MLGRSLKVLRSFHQLKQTELAKLLNISNSYLSEIENEEKTPSLDLLQSYAEVFKIPASSILLFSERIQTSKPSEKIRVGAAEKILRMLEWVADKNTLDNEAQKNLSA